MEQGDEQILENSLSLDKGSFYQLSSPQIP
jgi:hypothetical protein